MIDGKRVVAWTPYGREATVSILAQYMGRDHLRGIVDEWWLCLNTDPEQVDDLRYAYELTQHKWIKTVERPEGRPIRRPKQRNTGYFYEHMTDPDTVYVRFDDDIVYVHESAIERLARHRLEQTGGVASFPVAWNNSIISWYAQQAGIIPEAGSETLVNKKPFLHPAPTPGNPDNYTWPEVGGPYCMDPVGWADGVFAVAIHELFLNSVETDPERFFFYQDFPVALNTQFSVSTFASLGSLYAGLDQPGVLVPYEEEHWHTIHQPAALGVPNVIVGDALVSHYTFFPQGGIVRKTDILDRYRSLAGKLTV